MDEEGLWLNNNEAKMLAMALVEDRGGKVQLIRRDLTPYGRSIFDGLIDKLAAQVLGVDSSMIWHGRQLDPSICPCGHDHDCSVTICSHDTDASDSSRHTPQSEKG